MLDSFFWKASDTFGIFGICPAMSTDHDSCHQSFIGTTQSSFLKGLYSTPAKFTSGFTKY